VAKKRAVYGTFYSVSNISESSLSYFQQCKCNLNYIAFTLLCDNGTRFNFVQVVNYCYFKSL